MKKKILFVVPDGTGIKNYLFSNIIQYLTDEKVELIIYHALSDDALEEVENLHNVILTKKRIPKYRETKKQKFFREAICYARLHHNAKLTENTTILTNWNRNKKGVQKIFYKGVEAYGKWLSKNYDNIVKLEEAYQTELLKSITPVKTYLNELKPDVIFCTHQRALNAIPIVKAATVLGIKTVGAIYSWDNLPKARLSVRTDNYLVWSTYMKEELMKFYPEITEDKITITGTPQFELLQNETHIEAKNTFYKKYQLDPNKKIICFSGDDEKTSPYDPIYLKDLAETIANNGLKDQVQVIFRRCPVDLSGRYDAIVAEYNDFIVPIAPLWSNTQQHWSELYPFVEDVKLLSNICQYSDLVINLGSTMAHDFAVFNKPAAYINYDVKEDRNWSVDMIYKYEHFKSMPYKDVVYWINSKEDILKVLNQGLEKPESLAVEWLNIVNHNDENIAKNITQELLK